MELIYVRNGQARLIIIPENDMEKMELEELSGAQVTLASANTSILGSQIAGALIISLTGGQAVKKKTFFEKLFTLDF